jgi:hypothetical protein
VEVVLDGSGTDEQPHADVGVREAVPCEPGDLCLLRSEDVAGLVDALAQGLPRGQQLATGAIGERFGTHQAEHLVGGAQVLTRVHPAVLATQPLAVHEVRAGELHAHPRPGKALDRLTVELLRGVALAQERSRARLDA